MKVNLRKAHAIQNQIRDEINRLDLSTSVVLNEFENTTEQIETSRSDFQGALKTFTRLADVLVDIRKKVARANADEGISDLLADVAIYDSQIKQYRDLAEAKPQQNVEVLEGRLEKRRNSQEDSIYRSFGNDISTGIFSQEEIDRFRRDLADLKRNRQEIQDRILELNIETTIELDEDAEKLLSRLGIISEF